MHPAYSVIFFTTASGAGYGLLFWLGTTLALNGLAGARWLAFGALVLALALITAGLLASTLHLGRPERAIRAFSQWRSSWLAREGVAAVATYVPAGLLGLCLLAGIGQGLWPFLGALSAIGAVATVYCTGMIYASLRTIRQWNRPSVPLNYLVLAAASGALLFGFLLALAGQALGASVPLALGSLILGAEIKRSYWRNIDADPGRYTAEMALGLKGPIRPLDPPHTRPNFVMREMGYCVARNHARKLRRLTMIALFLVPLLMVVLAALLPGAAVFYTIAVFACGIGLFTERWLFFAEAEHVSQLYYGRSQA